MNDINLNAPKREVVAAVVADLNRHLAKVGVTVCLGNPAYRIIERLCEAYEALLRQKDEQIERLEWRVAEYERRQSDEQPDLPY